MAIIAILLWRISLKNSLRVEFFFYVETRVIKLIKKAFPLTNSFLLEVYFKLKNNSSKTCCFGFLSQASP